MSWLDRSDDAHRLAVQLAGAPLGELDGDALERLVELGIAVSAAAVGERTERERRGHLRLVASGGVLLATGRAPGARQRRPPRPWRRWLHRR